LDGAGPTSDPPPQLTFDFGDRRTFATEPPTELLARIQQFLPQIEQSNEELLQRDPHSIDMEHIEETDERIIQMNLGLGVFEQQRRAGGGGSASSSAESASDMSDTDSDSDTTTSSASSSSSSSSESTTGSNSEDDDDSAAAVRPPRRNTQRETRPLPNRARPLIQVLPSGVDEPSREPSAS